MFNFGGIMDSLLGEEKTTRQIAREHERKLIRIGQDLEKAIAENRAREPSKKREVTKLMKEQQPKAAESAMRDLVRIRTHTTRLYNLRSNVETARLQILQMNSVAQMTDAMRMVARQMYAVNAAVPSESMKRIMEELEKQNMSLDEKQQMMDASLNRMGSDKDENETVQQALTQIADELNIEMQNGMPMTMRAIPGLTAAKNPPLPTYHAMVSSAAAAATATPTAASVQIISLPHPQVESTTSAISSSDNADITDEMLAQRLAAIKKPYR